MVHCRGWTTLWCAGGWRTLLCKAGGLPKGPKVRLANGFGVPWGVTVLAGGSGRKAGSRRCAGTGNRGVLGRRGEAAQGSKGKSTTTAKRQGRVVNSAGKQSSRVGCASPFSQLCIATVNVLTLALSGTASSTQGSSIDALKLWLLQMKDHRIDIACFQECRVQGQVDLPPVGGYKCFFSGGKSRTNGVGIAVALSLARWVQETHYVSDRLMAVCFAFGKVKLTVLVAYAPAHSGNSAETVASHSRAVVSFWQSVERVICSDVSKDFRDNVILLGDFNARLGCGGDVGSPYFNVLGEGLPAESPDFAATSLLNFCVANRFHVADSQYAASAAGSATWVSRRHFAGVAARGGLGQCPELNRRGAIDHVLVRGAVAHAWCGVDDSFDTLTLTDHRVVRQDTRVDLPPSSAQHGAARVAPPGPPRLDWKSVTQPGAVQDRARAELSEQFLSLQQDSAIAAIQLYDELRARIFQVCAAVLPPAPCRGGRASPDWFTQNAAAIRAKAFAQSRAHKMFLRAPLNAAKKARWQRCQRATQQFCRSCKRSFWGDVGRRLSVLYEKNDLEGFYRGINMAYGAALQPGTSGRVTDSARAQLWDRAKKFRVPRERELERWLEHFTELLNQPGTAGAYTEFLSPAEECNLLLDVPFIRKELDLVVAQMKTGRATGGDNLPGEVEKFLYTETMLDLLLSEFNRALASGEAKQEWKDVVIAVLHKKGDKGLCDNYRGLSLINHTGKMLERLLQNRLLPFALRRGLIPRGQFGFLAGVGAADAQGLASHLADSASAQGLRTFRVFIDLTKAYDKVDREALWVIMGNAGVPPLFLALVKDLHTGAMATIKQGATLSTPFLLQRGLKQGSVFAPLLFNIFLGAVLHSCESQYKLNPALGVQFQW